MKKFALLALAFSSVVASAQSATYWQNHVDYRVEIDMDVTTNQFAGEQWLTYTNNSPDTIHEVFYHLYFNAFQPESMMDVRSRNIADPDRRVGDRISKLKNNEVGYHEVYFLQQDGQAVEFSVTHTLMKVELQRPIAPGDASVFHMKFNSQVPLQIRRSGRDNSEDIEYSMSQWYPKLAMYDEDGWHADPYVGREFYADFGRFVVDITIDKDYVVAGTGNLTNAAEVGHGYAPEVQGRRNNKITYKFVAENVHDFAWAADPDFKHEIVTMENGPDIHFFYDPETANEENWKKLMTDAPRYFAYMNTHFGVYQYEQFSVIQAGDGGMEYPMCTFMVGGGDEYEGFLGLFVHEATHNWYYGMLGTNEARYPWMDEGFTTYAEDVTMQHLLNRDGNPHQRTYAVYRQWQSSGTREPMSTHADHFSRNVFYTISSYYMGSMFLNQMRYIVGDEAFNRGMLRYFDEWKFKHPKPEDFVRIMEQESGMILDWYLMYWVDLIKPIDYSIESVEGMGQAATHVKLKRIGDMPMPMDVHVKLTSGMELDYTIPLVMMFGSKPGPEAEQPWPWTHPTYDLEIPFPVEEIETIHIGEGAADIDESNNEWKREE